MPLELSCRYYEEVHPPVGEAIMIEISQVRNRVGAYGELLEYGHKEALIGISDISRRRIRSIHQLVRAGMKCCCRVLRVNEERDYVDLAMLHGEANVREKSACIERFSKAKEVNSIMCYVAEILGYTEDSQLEELYEKTAWYFDRRSGNPGIGAYDAFKQCQYDPGVFDACDGLDDETKNVLINYINQRMAAKEVKITAEISVQCYTADGIDAIKAALKEGE